MFENAPIYVQKALDLGYTVEVDVWFEKGDFFLGHDRATYFVPSTCLTNNNVLCHAKHAEALDALLKLNAHCFWHENDRFVLTSRGILLSHVNETPTISCVKMDFSHDVLTRLLTYKEKYAGLCADFLP